MLHSLQKSLCLKNELRTVVRKCMFSTSGVKCLFWEKDPKGGYKSDAPQPSYWQHVKDGWKELKNELALFRTEVVEHFTNDPIINYQPGMIDKQWEFRSPEKLKSWIVTCDSDHGEGFSSCSLTLNSQGYGKFSGILDTTVPKDGRIKRSGYCSIKTERITKSFKRDSFHDWCPYTHLVLRVRGDGRSYMLNLATAGYYDQLWNDMYQYVLYTRGGPYWQVTKVPFSKFFFSSKGRIQDHQDAIPLDKITSFGITASDKINGPFCLEIDYIGCEYDPTHNETFAYESYELPRNLAGN